MIFNFGISKMMLLKYEAYTCGYIYSGGWIGKRSWLTIFTDELFGVSAAVPFLVAFCLKWGDV